MPENIGNITGKVAGAALTTKQYNVVKEHSTAGQTNVVTAITDAAYGILLNDPASGEEAQICGLGVCKAMIGTSVGVTAGVILGFNTTARLVPTTTDNRLVFATALEAGSADGDVIKVLVTGLKRY